MVHVIQHMASTIEPLAEHLKFICKDMEAVPVILAEILKQHAKSKKVLERCEKQGVEPESLVQHCSHMGWGLTC